MALKKPLKRTLELRKHFGGMPPLFHRNSQDDPFDPNKSEVIAWLVKHPLTKELVFQLAHNARAIVYDPDTRTWRGCNFQRRPRSRKITAGEGR